MAKKATTYIICNHVYCINGKEFDPVNLEETPGWILQRVVGFDHFVFDLLHDVLEVNRKVGLIVWVLVDLWRFPVEEFILPPGRDTF